MVLSGSETSRRHRASHSEAVRASDRDRKRKLAGRAKVERARQAESAVAMLDAIRKPEDPAEALFAWAAKLKVPPGHPRSGQPFVIPEFGKAFLRDVLSDSTSEALLCISRKNGKSAILSLLLLAHISDGGPLRRRGFRAGVISVNLAKAGELARQMEAIAKA